MATSRSSFSSTDLANVQHKDAFYLEHAQTLEEVRLLFDQVDDNLKLIDTIQRLALDHHFSKEIGAVLQQLYAATSSKTRISNDLNEVSLTFRLLRQAGFHVSQDVFTYFMNEKGKFKNNLSDDTKGLLALYEASHLGLEGEDILDEATTFSSHLLRANLAHIDDDHQARMVKYSLQNPHHKSVARLIAKNFVENVVCENEWETLLQDLARMELNMVGSLFQEEVLQVVGWWNGLGLTRELKSARSQPMKWHMWSMTVLLDPSWSFQRILLTKPISLVYIVDDIFDLYGTLDQLTLFTQAVKSWEICETEGLPDYMKMCFKAIQETTQEISHIVYQEHGWNPLDTLKRSWENLFDAFLTEAKWFGCGQLPKADEYLKNGIVSSGVPMVLSHLFFIMGDGLSRETEVLLGDTQCILYSVAMILRLLDDLGNAQDEHQDGHDGSYIECYMKEFDVSSYKVAKKHVMNMISDTWKRLNKQCLSSTPFSPSFTKACLNVARMVPIMYDYDESHALPVLEDCLESMLGSSHDI
ncbi:hypothetical protein Pfo_005557 [Paulownia fortunei]|nr:hypothetical protein Pfo_005557 [Paulownia fortunei]